MYFKALVAFAMVAGYCYAGPVETTPTPLTTAKPGNLSGLISDSLPNAENATNVTTTKKPSRRELTTPLPMNDTAPMPTPGKNDSKICLDHIPSDEQIMARIMDCGLLDGDKIDSKAAADKLAACNKTGTMPPAKSLSRRELKEMMDKKKKEDKKEEKKEDKKEEPKPDEMKDIKEDLPADKLKKKPEEKMPARRGLPKADDKNATLSNSTDKHNATDCDKKDLKVDPAMPSKNDTKPDMPTTAAPSRRRRDAYGKSEVKSEPKYATRSSSYSSRVMKDDSYSAPAVREESYSAPAVKAVKESYAPAVKSESYSAPAVREESYAVKTVKEDSYSAPQREESYKPARVVKRGPIRSSY